MDSKVKPLKYLWKRKVKEYFIDETAIKADSNSIWLWVIIEPNTKKSLLWIYQKKQTMFVAERFLSQVVNKYGLHSVSFSWWYWYPQACRFLKINHHIHSSFEKSLIERTMQYVKDRIEIFDDYFPCRKNKYKLHYNKQWLKLLVYQHNQEIMS